MNACSLQVRYYGVTDAPSYRDGRCEKEEMVEKEKSKIMMRKTEKNRDNENYSNNNNNKH